MSNFIAKMQMLIRKNEQLQAEAEKYKKAALKYGMHLDNCPCYIPDGKWKENNHHSKTDNEPNIIEANGMTTITVRCTCGYAKILGQSSEGDSE